MADSTPVRTKEPNPPRFAHDHGGGSWYDIEVKQALPVDLGTASNQKTPEK
jgi:hypothetical protein